MKIYSKAALALGILLVLSSVPGRAAPTEEAISLEKAVEIALARNPLILSYQADVRAAAARRLQSQAKPEPQISLDTAGIPFDFKAQEGRETELSLGLTQTFEFPGRRTLRMEIGRFGEDLAALELERARVRLAAEVKRTYYRAILAEQTAAALENTVGLLDRLGESIQSNFASGKSPYADVLRTRVEKARVLNRIIEERRTIREARTALTALLGGEFAETARLGSNFPRDPLTRTTDQIKKEARNSSPSVKIAALLAERASASMKLAGLNGKPDLNAGFFLPSKNFGGWGFALSVSLPLSKARIEGERAEAAAGFEAARFSAESAAGMISARINALIHELQAAEEQVGVFEKSLLEGLEDEIKISLDYYRLGRMDTVGLLDLYRTMTEARIEHVRALFARALALIDLEAAGETGE